jgi:hypothetical protein
LVAWAVGGVLWMLASACGQYVEEPSDRGGAAGGRICYSDSECVPAGCCGQAIGAIHVTDAQSCSNVRCSGTCPSNMTHCGCGLPVCRDGSCTVALRHDSQCP